MNKQLISSSLLSSKLMLFCFHSYCVVLCFSYCCCCHIFTLFNILQFCAILANFFLPGCWKSCYWVCLLFESFLIDQFDKSPIQLVFIHTVSWSSQLFSVLEHLFTHVVLRILSIVFCYIQFVSLSSCYLIALVAV